MTSFGACGTFRQMFPMVSHEDIEALSRASHAVSASAGCPRSGARQGAGGLRDGGSSAAVERHPLSAGAAVEIADQSIAKANAGPGAPTLAQFLASLRTAR